MIHVDEGNLRNRFAFSIILFVRLKVNFYICVIAWNMKYEMGKRLRIVYCIPSVYKMGGMERVLALKVNFFVETFGYEVHIITTEGISGTPFFNFHPDYTSAFEGLQGSNCDFFVNSASSAFIRAGVGLPHTLRNSCFFSAK